MKCPKCKYSSFPYLERCPQCGFGLAEQRAVFGVYALPPDPPDLLLAYQAATLDVTPETRRPRVSATGIELGELDGIGLEVSEVDPDAAGLYELEVPATTDPDSMSTLGGTLLEEAESAPMESSSARLSPQEISPPQGLDLSELGDITLAIEPDAELASDSPDNVPTPGESAAVRRVYDLDLDEDLDGLRLGDTVETYADDDEDADDEVVEYTLEIEDEVEFEIEELEDEDDNDR